MPTVGRAWVGGTFLIYRHRIETVATIAIPPPGSGPTDPDDLEPELCFQSAHTINALALRLSPDTDAIPVGRLTQIAMLTGPGAEPTPELLAQIHQIARTLGS